MSDIFLLTKIILAIVIAFNAGLMFFVLQKKKSILNIVLSFLAFGTIGWTFFIFINLWLESLIVEKFIFAFAVIMIVSQYWFAKIFPKPAKPSSMIGYWSLGFGAFFFIASFLPGALFNTIRISDLGYTEIDNGFLSGAYFLFAFVCIIAAIAELYRKMKRPDMDAVIRQQIKFLFFGYVFYEIAVVATNLILPVFFRFYYLNGIGPVLSLILIGFILYIISRYRFLDIRLIVQRGFIYTIMLSIITAFYLLMVFVAGKVFQETTNTTILFSAGLVSVFGILGFRPIEKYFSRLTDRIFFKYKYDYSKALRELSEIMNVTLDLKGLIGKSSDKLEEIFKTNNIEIIIKKESMRFEGGKAVPCKKDCPRQFLEKLKHYHEMIIFSEIPFIIENRILNNPETKEALEKLRAYGESGDLEVYVPIFLKGKILGAMFIGEKLSGDPYSKEDLSLLGTFSYQFAIALEKSRLYEAEKKYAGELEEKVRARTAKIEKLQQEQKQMMIDISHGLQTPLAIVKGESEFLQEELPDNKHVKVFEKSIDQVSKFIYDMLNLARLETTDEDFRKERVDLSGLMEELVEYFDILVKENNIKIEKEIEPGISVMGRKDKLEELVNNLVSNSIKYIDNERLIKISLKRNKDKARLVVEDTGMGINPMFIPNLFSRFYRVKDEKHAGIKGTGIGLSIVKQIVEKHRGAIRVESMEGKWTRMIVELKSVK